MAYMARKHKAYRDLTFADDFMFCRVLENDLELCRRLIEVLLDQKIRRVVLVDSQHEIRVNPDIKSVRLDVYVDDDEGTVYDLEMQTVKRPIMPHRSRYYQSMIDIDHLSAGASYSELPESYVIFICTFDPFGESLARYEFRNICEQYPYLELHDGTHKVFINATSKQNDLGDEMKALLDYIIGFEPTSDLTQCIADRVSEAKSNKKWGREYMLIEDIIKESRA